MLSNSISASYLLQILGISTSSTVIFSDDDGCNAPNKTVQQMTVSHQLAILKQQEAPTVFKKPKAMIIMPSNKESLVELI